MVNKWQKLQNRWIELIPVTTSQSQITKMGAEPISSDVAIAIAEWKKIHIVPYNLSSRRRNRNRLVEKSPYA